MKKVVIFSILMIILMTFISAEPEVELVNKLVNLDSMTLEAETSFDILLKAKSSDAVLKQLEVNKTFVPLNSGKQTIISQDVFPEGYDIFNNKDHILYKFYGLRDTDIKLGQKSIVNTEFVFPKIKNKITLPLNIENESLLIYTQPSANIDSDNIAIRQKAKEIIGDEDDMYIAVHKIATWVETEINYSLETLTESVTQKSSWVLNNRFGVCDELTSLFIAMLRSQGIPAKYISGMAYTNFDNLDDWGPHAWAEVYFPEYGWVPFDITYHEFGFLDATHIKFKESADSSTTASDFKWINNNVDIDIKPIDVNIKSIDAGKIIKDEVIVTAKPLEENIGLNSYNLIEIDIENPFDYYMTYDLYLTHSDVMELVDGNHRSVLLLPNAKKTIYFRIKHKQELDENFAYQIPFIVYNQLAEKAQFTINSKKSYRNLAATEVNNKFDLKEQVESGNSNNSISCTAKTEIFEDEKLNVKCDLLFADSSNLEVCYEQVCESLSDSEIEKKTKSLVLSFKDQNHGNKYIPIYLKQNEDIVFSEVNVNVKEIAKIELKDINYENGTISFVVEKKSELTPKNLEVELYNDNFARKPINVWKLESLANSQKFNLIISGHELGHGENELRVIVKHQFMDREYNQSLSEIVEIEKSGWNRFLDFFVRFANNLF